MHAHHVPAAPARVLVVDDDSSFRASLADAFADEPYVLQVCADGLEALEAIRRQPPDVVVTDVSMPGLDGVSLLRELLAQPVFVPCLVMTAFGTPTLAAQVASRGGIELVHKPLDLDQLKRRIRDLLETRGETSLVRGLALPSFLQLLGIEKKTCAVKVVRGSSTGLLFLEAGALVHAATGTRQGSAAFDEMMSWPAVEISVHDGIATQVRSISDGLDQLLLDALRRSDEDAHQFPAALPRERAKENAMALESYLEEFKGIKGYLAAGIMDFTGELLAGHSVSSKVDLAATGAVFNDIFRSAHEASRKIDLDTCRNLVISTPKGLVVMECSGADKQPHVHMVVVLEEGGNQALAKVTIAKVLPKAVADLC